MNDMEKAILDIIKRKYKCIYNGGLKVVQMGTGGYKLTMEFGIPDKPLIEIAADLNAEDFLKYVEQELISRQLHRVKYFRGVKIYPEDEERRTCLQN